MNGARALAALCALLLPLAASSQAPTDALIRALHQRYPEMNIDQVRETPMPGVYEAVAGDTVFYVDATGRYALKGTLVDLERHVNLTLMTQSTLRAIEPGQLPLADAFTIVHGNGARPIYLFEDPDCPYCKRLEREALADLPDVTIHVFLFPIVSLHPDAHRKAVSVWCADDRRRAWENVMRQDEPPESRTCDNPVDRNVALAEQLGVDATPTLVFADGRRVAGVVTREQIQAMLGAASEVPPPAVSGSASSARRSAQAE